MKGGWGVAALFLAGLLSFYRQRETERSEHHDEMEQANERYANELARQISDYKASLVISEHSHDLVETIMSRKGSRERR